MIKPIRRLLLAAVAGLSLGACARSEPEADVPLNAEAAIDPGPTMDAPAPVDALPSAPTEPAVEANATAELPPEAATAPDEQMLDDASATGMTARASRGEEDASVANVEE